MRWRSGLWEREVVRVVRIVDKVLGELGYSVKLSLFQNPSKISTETREEGNIYTV